MKKIIRKAHKTEFNPTKTQVQQFKQHCGIARKAYNWGLERKQNHYEETGKSLSAIDLHKELVQLKKTEFSYMKECSKCAPQFALMDLEKSYKNFFEGSSKFPKFKSKHKSKLSFALDGEIRIEHNRIRLPKIGWIKLKEHDYLPLGKPKKVTISCRADRWFVSINFETEIKQPKKTKEVIGIDLGIKNWATLSNDKTFENPKILKSKLKHLKRKQRQFSRKEKGSNNRNKCRKQVAKLHFDIANIRKYEIYNMIAEVARTKPRVIIIEDLNVSGMMKNHKLSRSIVDSSFGEIRRILEYKCDWLGIELVIADRWYPSSKKCSSCGHIKNDLKLSNRIYKCEHCGLEIDRDLNAAINLKNYYFMSVANESNKATEKSSGSDASGESSAGFVDNDEVKLASVKEELEFNHVLDLVES